MESAVDKIKKQKQREKEVLTAITSLADFLEKKLETLERKHRKSQDDAMDIYVLASINKDCEQCVKVKVIAHSIISE